MTINGQYDQLRRASPAEKEHLAQLAIGRILRLGSRSEQPGDIHEYEDARAVLLAVSEDSE